MLVKNVKYVSDLEKFLLFFLFCLIGNHYHDFVLVRNLFSIHCFKLKSLQQMTSRSQSDHTQFHFIKRSICEAYFLYSIINTLLFMFSILMLGFDCYFMSLIESSMLGYSKWSFFSILIFTVWISFLGMDLVIEEHLIFTIWSNFITSGFYSFPSFSQNILKLPSFVVWNRLWMSLGYNFRMIFSSSSPFIW